MQASAVAHPNVALIKYWGKRDTALNIPATGSLSLTLGGLETRTTVRFAPELQADTLLLNGRAEAKAQRGAVRCLNALRAIANVGQYAAVETTNNFPTGAGLASSASGYAALVTAAAAALGLPAGAADQVNIARQGSGSAPRSLFPGIVVLEATAHEVRCRSLAAPDDWPLHVVVAVTSRAEKAVGSTAGMELSRNTSPYYQAWLDSHPADMAAAIQCVRQRDFAQLAELAEHSCLKMHALAMSTRPPLVYWNSVTLAALERVRELRAAGVPVFFTIDAGPQLKAVCLPEAAATVRAALADCPGVLEVLDSPLGAGARVL
ncbi:MAG: diphosphomevalonate decarboxylase [Gammaproteobacteria bacterium]|jgi:diphosphomevalonate decarboxylase|nr:diphosphomevalonate decarboxylase [Gammaproteobacteria bacterium]